MKNISSNKLSFQGIFQDFFPKKSVFQDAFPGLKSIPGLSRTSGHTVEARFGDDTLLTIAISNSVSVCLLFVCLLH